jgi:phage antirepressor YoqD-like protein
MTNLIKNWNDRAIRIRSDRYVSLTDTAQATGKNLGHWLENKATHSYLNVMSTKVGIPTMAQNQGFQALVETRKGGDVSNSGTWGHPKVAIRFAQWCSDEFAVQVDIWTDELMTTGKVELVPTQPALPQSFSDALRMLAAEVEAKEALEKEIKILAPKADLYDTVMDSETWLDVRELFKCLALPKYKEKDFRAFLCSQDVKILSKDTHHPYALWIQRGLAKLTPVTLPNGAIYNKPVFSWKGCEKIIQSMRSHGVIPATHQVNLELGYKVVKV